MVVVVVVVVVVLTCSIEGPSINHLSWSMLLLILSRRSRSCKDLFTYKKKGHDI